MLLDGVLKLVRLRSGPRVVVVFSLDAVPPAVVALGVPAATVLSTAVVVVVGAAFLPPPEPLHAASTTTATTTNKNLMCFARDCAAFGGAPFLSGRRASFARRRPLTSSPA
jgi:hypothetical protein